MSWDLWRETARVYDEEQVAVLEREESTLMLERFGEIYQDCGPCAEAKRWALVAEVLDDEHGWVCRECSEWFAWLSL